MSYWVGPTSNISPRVRTLRSWAKSWAKRMSQLETARFIDLPEIWLVVWKIFNFFSFPFSWECHHPNWRFVIFFQRGRFKPPTRNVYFVRDFACWIRWSGRFETTKISITKITGSRFYGNFRIRLIAGTYLISGLCKTYIREYTHNIWPYMVQYLHFRFLKWPLIDSPKTLKSCILWCGPPKRDVNVGLDSPQ